MRAPSIWRKSSRRWVCSVRRAWHPIILNYQLTAEIVRGLSDTGFSIVSGGGPGLMELASKGAFAGKSPSIGLNIALPQEQSANEYQDISLHFRRFFSCKVMFVKNASAYGVLLGASRIILVHIPFWAGLIECFKATLVKEATIDAADLDLVQMLDKPQEVVDAIFNHYE